MVSTTFDRNNIKPHRSLRVLQAAEELISERGFAGLNLDTVVERAGCSKSTVYEFFGSKEGLLIALLDQLVDEFQQQLEDSLHAGTTLEEGLFDYARLSLQRVLSDHHISLLQAILIENRRSPEIGKMYFRTGPTAAIHQVAAYIEMKTKSDGPLIDDCQRAAGDFYSMIFGHVYARLFGAEKAYSDAAIENESRRIVQVFMRSLAHAKDDAQ